jgi:hypothetical protein
MELPMHEIVKKLIGPVYPIGETNKDSKRLERLKILISLADDLLHDIGVVSTYKDRPEWSMQKAGKVASEYFELIGDTRIIAMSEPD